MPSNFISRQFSLQSCLTGLALALCLSFAACFNFSEKGDSRNVSEAVRAVIEKQAADWNNGDIEAYMNGYEHSDDTMFISGDNLMRGWQSVLDRYKKTYDSREKMGTLTFSELEIKPLSPFYAIANGRWRLDRAGDQPHGRFTLLFRRTASGWRIIQDHTS